MVLDDVLGPERLIRKTHVHHAGGMTLGQGQVHQPPFAEQGDSLAALQRELLHAGPNHAPLAAELLQRRDVQLHIEMAGVADDGAVFHRREMLAADHLQVAGDGDEEVADLGGLLHRHDPNAIHHSLQPLDRIDFGHDDIRPQTLGPHGDAAPAPAVARDDDRGTADQAIRPADDPVHRGLARAVAVIEQVLGLRIVDRDDGELEDLPVRHAPQSDDARRRFLGPADHILEQVFAFAVQDRDDIRAVVHRDLRPVLDGRLNVAVVGLVVLALDRKDGDAIMRDQRGGHVVLGAERVRGAEPHVRPSGLQRFHEIRRLGGHVQTGGRPQTFERLLALEPFFDQPQHGHGGLGPFDLQLALLRQLDVFHIVVHISSSISVP